MPVLKHAKKKLRQDKKRMLDNLKIKNTYKKLIKAAKASKHADAMAKAYSAIDKAAKKNVIHPNKASRLKSTLAKVAAGTIKEVTQVKKKTKTTKKVTKKSDKAGKPRKSKKK